MLKTLLAATSMLLTLSAPAAAAVPDRIDFTIAPTSKAADRVQFGLSYRTARGKSQSSRPISLSELQGLSAAQLASTSGTPVRFRLVRDAGTIDCDGIVRQQRGTGDCRFVADPAFAGELARRGVARPTIDQQFQLALHGADLAVVDELNRQGYAKPSPEDLVETGIFGITAPRLRALDAAGYRAGTVDKLVEMSIHGVTPDYIREMAAIGPAYRKLPVDQLVEMRIHGVTPAKIRAFAEVGYPNLTRKQIMDMAIHGVTPAFVQEMASAGYGNLPPEKLVEMRIFGVNADMARRANAAVGRRN
jgi:hypothetical protein